MLPLLLISTPVRNRPTRPSSPPAPPAPPFPCATRAAPGAIGWNPAACAAASSPSSKPPSGPTSRVTGPSAGGSRGKALCRTGRQHQAQLILRRGLAEILRQIKERRHPGHAIAPALLAGRDGHAPASAPRAVPCARRTDESRCASRRPAEWRRRPARRPSARSSPSCRRRQTPGPASPPSGASRSAASKLSSRTVTVLPARPQAAEPFAASAVEQDDRIAGGQTQHLDRMVRGLVGQFDDGRRAPAESGNESEVSSMNYFTGDAHGQHSPRPSAISAGPPSTSICPASTAGATASPRRAARKACW